MLQFNVRLENFVILGLMLAIATIKDLSRWKRDSLQPIHFLQGNDWIFSFMDCLEMLSQTTLFGKTLFTNSAMERLSSLMNFKMSEQLFFFVAFEITFTAFKVIFSIMFFQNMFFQS